MTCPDCGYMMTAFDPDCPRCQRIGKPQKPCLKCGGSSSVRDMVCQHCSHRFGDPVEAPLPVPAETAEPHYANITPLDREEIRQIVQEVVAVQAQPASSAYRQPAARSGQIVLMWVLTVLAWVAFLSGGAPFGIFLDLIAVIMAIVLAASRAPADRANGWIKLILEGVAFFIAMVNSANAGH